MLSEKHSWALQVRKGVTMTTLAWDDVGERVYQTGIDRGILFLNDGTAVAGTVLLL